MEELIKITKSAGGKDICSARELYDYLQFGKSQWSRWSKLNIENNPFATERVDWVGFDIESNGNISRDYALTIPFAKKISMMARNERGETVRDYFIACEKKANEAAVSVQLPDFNNPAVAARAWADQFEARALAEAKIEEDAPKVKAAEIMLMSEYTVTVSEFAKSINFGPNKLFERLRQDKILINGGNRHNLPMQRYIDSGYFKVLESTRTLNEKVKLFHQSVITPKGQTYLANKYAR